MKNLASMSTKELVAEYNAHSGKVPIASWKKKVSELHLTLMKLRPDLYFLETKPQPSERMTDFEAPTDELAKQKGRPVDAAEPPATKVKAARKEAKERIAKQQSDRGAIRRLCEELLLKVKGNDPETKRPLGLPYSDILAEVRRRHPDADTSVNCLRWYATKLNKQTGKDRVVMPVRPKAKAAA